MYHPDSAPMSAPNASDVESSWIAVASRSEAVAPPVEPDPEPAALGLAAGEELGLAAGEPDEADVALATAIWEGAAVTVATALEGVEGVSEAVGIPPVDVNLSEVTPSTKTSVIDARKAAMTPASQVDLGARKPAIIGGSKGTG